MAVSAAEALNIIEVRCVYDPRTAVWQYSSSQNLLGYTPIQWQQTGFIESVIEPSLRAQWRFMVEMTVAGHTAPVFHVQMRRADGRLVQVACSFSGPLDALQLTLKTTAEPSANQVFRQHAYTALSQSNFPVFWLNAQGCVLEANAAVCEALQYSAQELSTLHVCELDAAEDEEPYLKLAATLAQNGHHARIETRFKRKDGSTFPVALFVQAVGGCCTGDQLYVVIAEDITDRLSAKKALEVEHQRTNHYLDIAGVIMVTLDLDGKITLLNRFACQLLGVEQQEALGLNWFDHFLPKPGSQIARKAYSRLMASTSEPNQKVEKPIITRLGQTRLILWYNRVLEDADGKRIGILSSGTDITELRHAEHVLQSEKNRLKTLIDAMPDLVFFKDRSSTFLGGNKAFVEFCGLPEEGFIGKTDAQLFAEASAAAFLEMDQQVLSSKQAQRRDEWVSYPDGHRVLLDTLKVPLFDSADELTGVLGVSRDITEHRLMSGQLSLVNAMVDHSLDPLICTSPELNFRIVYANAAAIKHFGISAAELYQTHIQDWDLDFPLQRLQSRWSQLGEQRHLDKTHHTLRDGKVIPVEVSSRAFTFQERPYLITVFKDLRTRIGYEEAVKSAEQRSRLLLENTNEGIFGLDTEGTTVFINPAAAKMLGYTVEELIGVKSHHLIHHSYADGSPMSADQCQMLQPVRDGVSYRVETDVLWRKDGTSFPVEYWSSPIVEGDQIVGAVVTFHDITHRKDAEEKIRYLAFHDALTGLPNRRLFMDRFEQELKHERRSGSISALLLMDIDHFKEVNDTLGHPCGDQLLSEIANRIGGALREGDTFARLGGDEFAILQSDIQSMSDIAALAEKVIRNFSIPFRFNGNKIKSGTSIGIVLCDGNVSANELIARADIALYRAKEQGRGCYVFYQEEMTNKVQRDAELAHMLSSARFLQQLYMVYQPQFDCATGRLVGLEALLRWEHPKQGLISPMTFIPVAEKRGMIDDIGLWVAHHVCQEVSNWLGESLSFGTLSFNLSPVQLRSEMGIRTLLKTLEESGVPLKHFEIEITESACMDASEETLALLESYVAKGLKLAIDDFGTGYSSMVSLKKLSASRLKIDRSFIRDMLHDPNDEVIVNATITLAHSLGLDVVAEGVETKEQLELLKQQGCDIAQGYFLGYPMKARDTRGFLRILGEKTGT